MKTPDFFNFFSKKKSSEMEIEQETEQTTTEAAAQNEGEVENNNQTVDEPTANAETAAPETAAVGDSEWKDRYLRMAADFDNFKKRTNKEKETLHKFANEQLLKAFLPVIDDVERALRVAETAQNIDAIKEGIGMMAKKLNTALEKQGVKPIASVGETFNSELHEAIAGAPMGDEQKGKVVEEIEKGFYYHDKIIRYAKVIIGE